MSETVYRSPEEARALFARQWQQAKRGSVECECERVVQIRFMYRCLYCGIWFCQQCAEIHFGKTREEWAKDDNDYVMIA